MWPHRFGQNMLDAIYFFLPERWNSSGQDDDSEENRAGNVAASARRITGVSDRSQIVYPATTRPLRRNESVDLAARDQFSRDSRGVHILRRFFAAGVGHA